MSSSSSSSSSTEVPVVQPTTTPVVFNLLDEKEMDAHDFTGDEPEFDTMFPEDVDGTVRRGLVAAWEARRTFTVACGQVPHQLLRDWLKAVDIPVDAVKFEDIQDYGTKISADFSIAKKTV